MKHNKEKTLINFRDSELNSECVCLQILELKRERLKTRYDAYLQKLEKAKTDGKNYQKVLGYVMKTGNKMRAIKEAIEEIKKVYEILSGMIEIEINGTTFSRLSSHSDFKRSCKGKVPYSESASIQAAVEVSAKLGETMENYKCRHCEHWHIGHSIFAK